MMRSDSGPADQRPRYRIDLPGYSVEWTKVTNRHFAESLNAKGLRWYDDDARFHRVAGEWVADASAGQSPVVEATWFGAQKDCRRTADGSRWRHNGKRRLTVPTTAAPVGRRAARSHPQAGHHNIGFRCAS